MTYLHKQIEIIANKHEELLIQQKNITMDQYNRIRYDIEATVKEISQHFFNIREIISFLDHKIKIYNPLLIKLKDLNIFTENAKNGKSILNNNL